MPLAYVACRRLRLERPAAYGVAMVAALLPDAFFYSEYAMTDAIFPALVLGWLLATHSWLTATTDRGRYAAAVGSALLAAYTYTVHSRGLVIVGGYVIVAVVIFLRRLAPRGSVLAAAAALCLPLVAGLLLNRHLSHVMYPNGARSLASEALNRLHSVHGLVFIGEMAGGQLWRFTLDGWGVAALGMVAALVAIARRDASTDLRIMALLAAGITLATSVTAPAALPPQQAQGWVSGRYLDGMVVAFFLPGAALLLRASRRRILLFAAAVVPPTALGAAAVATYAGPSLPTAGFGSAFTAAEPAVLSQNWNQASVAIATSAAVGLLAVWVAVVLVVPRWRAVVLAGLGAVSLVAVVQMTTNISQEAPPSSRKRQRPRFEAG